MTVSYEQLTAIVKLLYNKAHADENLEAKIDEIEKFLDTFDLPEEDVVELVEEAMEMNDEEAMKLSVNWIRSQSRRWLT